LKLLSTTAADTANMLLSMICLIRTTKSVSSAFVVVIIASWLVTFSKYLENLECEGLQVKSAHKTTAFTRRDWLSQKAAVIVTTIGICNDFGWCDSSFASATVSEQVVSFSTTMPQPWIGTNLPLLSLEQAVEQSHSNNMTWKMGRWPDPILRQRAMPVDEKWFTSQTLQQAATLLKSTADHNGAVGLAAQQCGVNARMVYLSPKTKNPTKNPHVSKVGTILVNPYVVARSPEADMRVWVEECLVLPSSFQATVLRDAWIDVQYHTVDGQHHLKRFCGEAGRCLQHELDHDRGILITDHVMLNELPDIVNNTKMPLNMRKIEAKGHHQRMIKAYDRFLDNPSDTTDPENSSNGRKDPKIH
jgi:peptide deformylase